MTFHILGIISPTDELIFFRGYVYHQPGYFSSQLAYTYYTPMLPSQRTMLRRDKSPASYTPVVLPRKVLASIVIYIYNIIYFYYILYILYYFILYSIILYYILLYYIILLYIYNYIIHIYISHIIYIIIYVYIYIEHLPQKDAER